MYEVYFCNSSAALIYYIERVKINEYKKSRKGELK